VGGGGGWGGGGGGAVSKTIFFRPFVPQFSLKITGWADLQAPSPDPPLVCILYNCFCTFQPFYQSYEIVGCCYSGNPVVENMACMSSGYF